MSEEQRTFETSAEPEGQPAIWPTYEGGEEGRAAAVRSLHRKRDFWDHCAAYVNINGLLVALWLVFVISADAWFFWPIFPLAGWGIGLAFHAASAYGPADRPITDAEIQNEMQRLHMRLLGYERLPCLP